MAASVSEEGKLKRKKHDQMVDVSEDESSSSEEDESRSESLSNKQVGGKTTMGKQKLIIKTDENTKQAKRGKSSSKKPMEGSSSPPNIQKGSISEAVKVAKKNRFQKKFSFQDEEKILQMMIKAGEKDGYQAFWKKLKDSMQLSHSANEYQLYEKTRRLKAFYKKNLESNNLSKDDQEYKVYKLADELWGEDERAKIEAEPKDNQQQQQQQRAMVELASNVKKNKEKNLVKEVKEVEKTKTVDDDDTEYKQKYNKFLMELANKSVDFPVTAAMEVVEVSKRSNLEKKWEDMGELCLKTYKKKARLVLETLEVVKPSPSHHSNA